MCLISDEGVEERQEFSHAGGDDDLGRFAEAACVAFGAISTNLTEGDPN